MSEDIKMKKIYYNCEIINSTAANIEAKFDVDLLNAIVDMPMKYNANINRFRLPLSSIPLTQNNIPFDKWQIGLGYLNPSSNSISYESEYVPQYDQLQADIGSYVFQRNSNGNYSFNEGILLNNVFESQYTTPYSNPINSNPIVSSNSLYFALTFGGTYQIQIYDIKLILQQTITHPTIVNCIFMQKDTNDIYVGSYNSSGFIVQVYTYSIPHIWSLGGALYTLYSNTIIDPYGLAYNSGTLFVSDYIGAKIFIWNANGEILNSNTINLVTKTASCMTIDNSNNIAVCMSQLPISVTSDNLYINNNDSIWSVTPYTAVSQGIVIAASVFVNNIMLNIGNNANVYYMTYPFLASNNWTLYNTGGHSCSNLLASYAQDTLYIMRIEVNSLWNIYIKNIGNISTPVLIGSNFIISPTVQIQSLDSMSDNRVIAIGSDNLVYKSNYPLVGRSFALGNRTSSKIELFGIDSNTNMTTCTPVNMEPFIATPTNTFGPTFKSCCFDGVHYWIANSLGSVDTYTAAFVYVANYAFTECNSLIGRLHHGVYSQYIYAGELSAAGSKTLSNINFYNKSGVYQGKIIGGYIDCFFEIQLSVPSTIPALFIIQNFGIGEQSIINLVNIDDPAFPAILTFNEDNDILDITFDPNLPDPSTMTLWVLEQANNTQIIRKIVIEIIAYQVTVQSSTTVFTSPFANNNLYSIDFINTTRELVLMISDATSLLICNYSGTNSYSFTVLLNSGIIPSNLQFFIPIDDQTNYLTFSQVTSATTVKSICSSRVIPNKYYATNTANSIIYSGSISANAFTWTNMNFPASSYYSMISNHKTVQAPVSYSGSIDRYNASGVLISSNSNIVTDNGGGYEFISLDKDGVLVYSPRNTNILGTENSSSLYAIIPGMTNLYSNIYAGLQNINSPKYWIWSYQAFLDKINSAYSTAFTNLKTKFPAYAPTVAPRIVFNSQTKLFSILCQLSYLQDTQNPILMNTMLYNHFNFPTINVATQPTDFKTMNAHDDGFNTTATMLSIYQEGPSYFTFNDLIRILVSTSKIAIAGDIEGINSTVNLITDVIVDTSSTDYSDVLVYQPTVLRNYNVDTDIPIKKIQIQFYYGSRDGTIHPVTLNPTDYASCKIEFEQVVK